MAAGPFVLSVTRKLNVQLLSDQGDVIIPTTAIPGGVQFPGFGLVVPAGSSYTLVTTTGPLAARALPGILGPSILGCDDLVNVEALTLGGSIELVAVAPQGP